MKKHFAGIFMWVLAVFLTACTSGQIPLIIGIDTPEYHVDIGEKMLVLNKVDSAFREFNRALDLDPKYSPAYVGLALAHAAKGATGSGMDALADADRYARGKDQEVGVYVGYMRFFLAGADKSRPDWLQRVREYFNRAILIDDENPVPHYYMGMAYKTSGQIEHAAKKFYRVMEIGKGFAAAAEKEYRLIERKP